MRRIDTIRIWYCTPLLPNFKAVRVLLQNDRCFHPAFGHTAQRDEAVQPTQPARSQTTPTTARAPPRSRSPPGAAVLRDRQGQPTSPWARQSATTSRQTSTRRTAPFSSLYSAGTDFRLAGTGRRRVAARVRCTGLVFNFQPAGVPPRFHVLESRRDFFCRGVHLELRSLPEYAWAVCSKPGRIVAFSDFTVRPHLLKLRSRRPDSPEHPARPHRAVRFARSPPGGFAACRRTATASAPRFRKLKNTTAGRSDFSASAVAACSASILALDKLALRCSCRECQFARRARIISPSSKVLSPRRMSG